MIGKVVEIGCMGILWIDWRLSPYSLIGCFIQGKRVLITWIHIRKMPNQSDIF